ncbi:MAG: recombinase family protein [Candidatus Dehalobacter alkaniphilus]
MIYGYARVSTKGQQKDGNSLEAQEKALYDRGCDKVFREAFTGTTTERPVFSEVIAMLQPGDTLMVTKLDRFSRTAADGAKLVQELHSRGIIIEILNMGRADNTPMGKLMVTMLLAFAEFERDMIVERTSVGKEIAKQKDGYREGRPSIETQDFEKFHKKQKDGLITVKQGCKALGISRSVWYDRVRRSDAI